MRKQVTVFDTQYRFMKTFRSEKLMIAFLEYMFEDIEPTWLNEEQMELFESLRDRMDNCKKKIDAWSIWWSNSHWWWRPKNKQENNENEEEKQTKNKQKTSTKQTENNQDKDKDKEEDKDKEIIKEKINKQKYLDFVLLTEEEHEKLINQLWQSLTNELIDKLNNYIWSTWRRYKSHYFTILNWSKKERPMSQTSSEMMKERERQRIREEAQQVLNRNNGVDGDNVQTQTTNRRANIIGG